MNGFNIIFSYIDTTSRSEINGIVRLEKKTNENILGADTINFTHLPLFLPLLISTN